jgi:hypothetical protein
LPPEPNRDLPDTDSALRELQRNSALMNLIKADKAGKVAFHKVPDED